MEKARRKRKEWLVWGGLLLLLAYFPLFLHLENLPLKKWDESLFAVRALYLLDEGDILFDYRDYHPDAPWYLSTKPPFTTLLQTASFAVLGPTPLALRLPIALMGLGCVVWAFGFAVRVWGSPPAGFLAGWMLVSAPGFIDEHVARTGDQDVALTFYMLGALLAFFHFERAQDPRKSLPALVLFTFFLIAGTLTKNVMALLFLPGMVAYVWHRGRLVALLRRKAVWLAAALVLLAFGGYYLWQEWRHPGFLFSVWDYELRRVRYSFSGHGTGALFYLREFWSGEFFPFLLLLLPYLVPRIARRLFERYPGSDLVLFAALGHLLVLSVSASKAEWYEAPEYPLWSLAAAPVLVEGLQWLRARLPGPPLLNLSAGGLVVLGLFFFPYKTCVERAYHPKPAQSDERYGPFLRLLESRRLLPERFTIPINRFNGHAVFYAGLYQRRHGRRVRIVERTLRRKTDPRTRFAVGESVVVCHDHIRRRLERFFHTRPRAHDDHCLYLEITGIKEVEGFPLPPGKTSGQ